MLAYRKAYLSARHLTDAVHPKDVALGRSKCFGAGPCCRRLNRVGEVINSNSLSSFVAKVNLPLGRAVGWGRVGLSAPAPDLVCFPVQCGGLSW